jgi:hypothetical protein
MPSPDIGAAQVVSSLSRQALTGHDGAHSERMSRPSRIAGQQQPQAEPRLQRFLDALLRALAAWST